MSQWESTLQIQVHPSIWYRAFSSSSRFSRKITHWKTSMKIFYRWYYTPVKLAHIFPTQSRKCWRQCTIYSHIFHILWECPLIAPFWRVISNFIQDLTNVSNVLSPQMALFGLGFSIWPSKFHPVVTHILIAAHLYIDRLWKQPSAPTLGMTIDIIKEKMQHLNTLSAK